jgi:hypothetical protein
MEIFLNKEGFTLLWSKIRGKIGDLNLLSTLNKSNIVEAVNEVVSVIVQTDGVILKLKYISQADYDALGTKNANTLYVIPK